MFKRFYAAVPASLSKWRLSQPSAALLPYVKGTLSIPVPAPLLEGEWLSVIAEGEHPPGAVESGVKYFLPAISQKTQLTPGDD